MTSARKHGTGPPGPPDDLLHTGGALEGRLWGDIAAELRTRSSPSAPDSGDGAGPGAVPLQIGAYQLIGLLGSGGMGDVFLAKDDRLQRQVAIKCIRMGKQMNATARERLRREAAAAATLDHPAVIHIYDILDEPAGEAIVMEYVDGYTLAQILAAGRLPAKRAVGIGRQVAEGLAAAHAVGLIHRDLKTQNVMVTPSGQARILDFGLAKRFASRGDQDHGLTTEGDVVGTARAMSPEQAEGRALDPRSDLFSLGVLLYEICTGRSPFEGSSALQTLHNVIALPPPAITGLNPDLPAALVTLVEELLAKDRDHRPPSATRVSERLREIESLPALRTLALPGGRGVDRAPVPLAGVQTFLGARPPSAVLRTPAGRPHPRWRWMAGVGLAVLAAAGAALLIHGSARRVAVVVDEPDIALSPPDERSRFVAFALKEAANHVLGSLEGIDLIGRDELAEPGVSSRDAPRVAAADEVVGTTLTCERQWCHVSLTRRAVGGGILGDPESFDVSNASEDSLKLATAVGFHLRKVYRDHPPRSGHENLTVRSDDHSRFVKLRQSSEAGQALGPLDIDALVQIARSSPGLTEAYLLAVGTARRFLRDPARANGILQEAEARHPADPRLVYERFLLRLEAGQLVEAEKAVEELEVMAPGDVRVQRARARLLVNQGNRQEAAEVCRRMVRERPSWRNLWYLADIEIDLLDEQAARGHLDQLLALSPGNPRGLEKKAELEWLMGDPTIAAGIYKGLLGREVTFDNLVNLGWSLILAGDYSGAIEANQRALDLDAADDDLLPRFNLGVAYEGRGGPDDLQSARRLYQALLDRAGAGTGGAGLHEPMLQAQALARLHRCVEAITVGNTAPREDHRAQGPFRAAIVHALCGEENNAIMYATEARRRGLSWRWFRIPGFESLHVRPEFRKLARLRADEP